MVANAASDDRSSSAPGNPLDRCVGAGDGAFRLETTAVRRGGDGALFDVRLLSQRWRGIEWRHHLRVFVPAAPPFPDIALLVLREGEPGDRDAEALRSASRATGTASAYLYQIPNQPLLGGMREDELLAHTYSQYLRTGDDSWPLLFPMVRSVVRAMDAIGSLEPAAAAAPIRRFVVAGHSKRGHAAWLSAAADARVAGIVPLAIDVLNSQAQLAHHREVAGEISAANDAFRETLRAADSPRGRRLLEMIDPYTYRDRLTAPKLVVLGTNDAYTPTDALNLYWSGLPGPRSVLYLPNTTHAGVNAHPYVNPAAYAFVRAVASGSPLPELAWALDRVGGSATLRIDSSVPIHSARLWAAHSGSRDFRSSRWSDAPMREPAGGGGSVVAETGVSGAGYTALLGEVEFLAGGAPFRLSTPVQLLAGGRERG